jgi:hypothetical protein
MDNKPNLPEALDLCGGKRDYSLRTDWKVNGWLYVAVFLSGASDVFFHKQLVALTPAVRAAVACAPFLALILYTFSFSRWIRGMDELHRRITVSACFFATAATLFVVAAWNRLDRTGVFEVIFPIKMKPDAGWDISGVWVILGILTGFYILGGKIFNRRYQ